MSKTWRNNTWQQTTVINKYNIPYVIIILLIHAIICQMNAGVFNITVTLIIFYGRKSKKRKIFLSPVVVHQRKDKGHQSKLWKTGTFDYIVCAVWASIHMYPFSTWSILLRTDRYVKDQKMLLQRRDANQIWNHQLAMDLKCILIPIMYHPRGFDLAIKKQTILLALWLH